MHQINSVYLHTSNILCGWWLAINGIQNGTFYKNGNKINDDHGKKKFGSIHNNFSIIIFSTFSK